MIINDGTKKSTNKEIIDNMYLTLKALKEGKGAKNQKEKEKMESDFYHIVNGSQDGKIIMEWLEQIYNEKDPLKAQELQLTIQTYPLVIFHMFLLLSAST